MADGYNFLEGSQTDINRRLLRKIQALEKATGIDDKDIKALEETVGDKDSGLVKAVNGLVAAVGDAETAATIIYRLTAIETAIGDEDTADSILGRIKALEDA